MTMRTQEQNNIYRICSDYELNAKWAVAAKENDFDALVAIRAEKARRRTNKNRRDRHAVLTSLGLVRVRGSLGGTYYE